MIRVRYVHGLVLSTVVLSSVVLAELRYGVGLGHPGEAARETGYASQPVPAPGFALPDRSNLSETLSRPLFTPNRRPLDDATTASPTEVSGGAQPDASRYALSAIIIVDDERIALLTDTMTGRPVRAREGERLGAWTVETIREDAAVLSDGAKRTELMLRIFHKNVPSPQRRSPRRPRREDDEQGPAPSQGASSSPKHVVVT